MRAVHPVTVTGRKEHLRAHGRVFSADSHSTHQWSASDEPNSVATGSVDPCSRSDLLNLNLNFLYVSDHHALMSVRRGPRCARRLIAKSLE